MTCAWILCAVLISMGILAEGSTSTDNDIESRLGKVEVLLHNIINEEMVDMKEAFAQLLTKIQANGRDNQDQPGELDQIRKEEEIQRLTGKLTAMTKHVLAAFSVEKNAFRSLEERVLEELNNIRYAVGNLTFQTSELDNRTSVQRNVFDEFVKTTNQDLRDNQLKIHSTVQSLDALSVDCKSSKEDLQREVNQSINAMTTDVRQTQSLTMQSVQELSRDCKAENEDLRKELIEILKNQTKEINEAIDAISRDMDALKSTIAGREAIGNGMATPNSTTESLHTRLESTTAGREAIGQDMYTPTLTTEGLDTRLESTLAPGLSSVPCKNGWVRQLHSCILYVHDKALNWFAAKDYCKKRDSHLVEPSNASMPLLMAHLPIELTRWWIGVRDNVERGFWRWESTHKEADNLPWDEGEPNDKRGKENCVEIIRDRVMNDNECEKVAHFICEM